MSMLFCRLKEYCERLMFYNPLEYGRKAEEVLWRKVFYQIIQLIKQNRKVNYLRKLREADINKVQIKTGKISVHHSIILFIS